MVYVIKGWVTFWYEGRGVDRDIAGQFQGRVFHLLARLDLRSQGGQFHADVRQWRRSLSELE